jgi:hypothetical protein
MTLRQDLTADIDFLTSKMKELCDIAKVLENYEGYSDYVDLSDFAGDFISLVEDYIPLEVSRLTRLIEEEPTDVE